MKRGKQKWLAILLIVAMLFGMLPGQYALANDSGSLIDVWDFGAEQLDPTVYNNRLNKEVINSWYPSVASGSAITGHNIASFSVDGGDFIFSDGGYPTTHRLRSNNPELIRYDDKSLVDSASKQYNGYLYSNKGSTNEVFLGVQLDKNDILTVVVASNGGTSNITLEAPSGAKQIKTHTLGGSTASVLTYYAAESGLHKIYTMDEKLVVARVYRKHTMPCTVTGTVSAPSELTASYSVVFKNNKTGEVITAPVTNGNYTVSLHETYDYTVSLQGADGFVISEGSNIVVTEGASIINQNITVVSVPLITLTGAITGLSAEDLQKVNLSFRPVTEQVFVPNVVIDRVNGTYTAVLEQNVLHNISALNVNDYSLDMTEYLGTVNESKELTFTKKPVYDVTLNLVGLSTEEAAAATTTFTNLKETGYSYSFVGTQNITLRDGTYSVKVNSPKYQKLTSNLVVSGAAVEKNVEFEAPTEWNFSNPEFKADGTVQNFYGLSLNGIKANGGKYALGEAGASILIPVNGPCKIIVSYCYEASGVINGDDAKGTFFTDSKSTSNIENITYSYQGTSGTVEIAYKGKSYLTKIEILPVADLKTTLTVGTIGCDYTTIQAALEAVRAMERPNGERITIEIQPGNYEEMLVVDVPNVTLRNASTTPSIDLTNKGVSIASEAVRITSYYGHGYSYYSMGNDGKWDAETLAVNKANGSHSYTNPGSGTTNGSYWNATVVVTASGFEAEGIIFENSFNQYVSEKEAADTLYLEPGNKGERSKIVGDTSVQDKTYVERAAALAIANGVNEVYFDNCRFVGRQDTLYGGSNTKAAFNKCVVMGGCDYIFGPMTAVFYKCELVMNTSEGSTDVAYITAPQQSTGRGYLMYNCKIKSTTPGVDTASEKTSKPGYFGRPWQANTSEAVFYKTIIEPTDFSGSYESLIIPIGWLNTLGGTSVGMVEYGTMEALVDTDHLASRADWSTVLTNPVLSDNTDISTPEKAVTAFLGEWKPFALDAADDEAEIFVPTNPGSKPTIHTWDVTTLDSTGVKDKDLLPEGTYESYFKVVGTVTQRTSSTTGKITSVEVDKALLGAIQFTVTGTADVTVEMSSTGSSNKSAVGLIDQNGNLVTEKNNTDLVSGTGRTSLTFTGLTAGTYRIVSPANASYNRGARVYSVSVSEIEGVKPPRKDWSQVVAPVITGTQTVGGDVTVNFSMEIGYDGADSVTVTMKEGTETIKAITYAKDGSTGFVTFTPEKSGDYTFTITAAREAEVKAGVDYELLGFVLPLTIPSIVSAVSAGNGSVAITWNEVKEAQNYEVAYKTVDETDFSVPKVVSKTECVLEGLTVGLTYTLRVKAVRGGDSTEATTNVKVTQEAQRAWSFAAFGQGVDTINNFYSGNALDGQVKVVSQSGKGKLVPASTDGLAFYYTKINAAEENFILRAKVSVDTWTYSNGQEGFGLMAADDVGVHGDSSVFWNNSYMASVTKVEYLWDKINQTVSDAGDKITMKIGIGAQEKKGVTAENIADGTINTNINELFSSKMATIETSCANSGAGTYNIVGNYANSSAPEGTIANPRTTFDLAIQRDNTGYRVSYTDGEGNTTTKLYYDLERNALTQIDKDNIYVGFFASRNANITVSDIALTISDPKTDPPAEERPVTLVTPSYTVTSATAVGTSGYDLVFRANADGVLTMKNANGQIITKDEAIKANTNITKRVYLSKGNNTFQVTFTPDKDYKPSEFEKLSSYDTVTFSHTVLYKNYGQEGQSIYVTPNGSPNGNGTKANPLDIYTAVKHVQPGQTIVLAGGTYSLTSTVKIDRGINGTADKKIYMVADPNATSRPVFDFNGTCAGMILAGDYWYLKGFDVTKSQDAQKGIQVSGSNCVLDQINTYHNGNTGIQISRYLSTDEWDLWPANNLILNCTSYGNADRGYEDADGFAAKLTIADGNVFDGCIAYNNADDGWDLFAKVESGPIGKVIIRNSVAYKNGYLEDGTNAGNGNGFKLGGSSMSGHHRLENSVAFGNKAKGIDSNSCPDIEVINCTTFNNESYNVALYTNDAVNTDFYANGILSYRTLSTNVAEQFKFKGTQDETKVYGSTNYYWDVTSSSSMNQGGNKVASDWFESLTLSAVTRNANGTVNMNGYLVLTEKTPVDTGARVGGIASLEPVIGPEVSDAVVPEPTDTPTVTPTPTTTPTITPTPELTQEEILEQITPKRTGILYTGGKTSNLGWFGLKLPENVVKVSDFDEETVGKLENGMVPMMITYHSNNPEIVTVKGNGRLIAKESGIAVITATVTMQDGTTEIYTRKLSVRKASVDFIESTVTMKVGEEAVFEVKVNGLDADSIVWKSSKKDGAVVKRNPGSTTATITAVSPKTDYIYVVVDGVKKTIKVVITE